MKTFVTKGDYAIYNKLDFMINQKIRKHVFKWYHLQVKILWGQIDPIKSMRNVQWR